MPRQRKPRPEVAEHVADARRALDDVRTQSIYAARMRIADPVSGQWRKRTEEEHPDANPYWWDNRTKELLAAQLHITAALKIAIAERDRLFGLP